MPLAGSKSKEDRHWIKSKLKKFLSKLLAEESEKYIYKELIFIFQ